jgi:long-chain fatty acid transport protein
VDAYKEATASVTYTYAGGALTDIFDFEQDGTGIGGIFGLNIAPNEKLNIGVRYETETELDLEAKVNSGNPIILGGLGIVNGQETPRNLPAIFALGASYWFTPKIRVETNLTYYLNEDADWGGAENLVDNGYDAGIAFEYHLNDSLLASIGYIHTKLGVDPQNMQAENPELNVNSIGAGIAYAINDKLHTNISIGNSFYDDDSFNAPPTVEFEKNVFYLVAGMEYRF